MKTNIKQAAAKRLTEMELGEVDSDFGFSVEDIEEPSYEESKYVSYHSLIWRDHEVGTFHRLDWEQTKEDSSEAIFDVQEDLIWCHEVVPEQVTKLIWKRVS